MSATIVFACPFTRACAPHAQEHLNRLTNSRSGLTRSLLSRMKWVLQGKVWRCSLSNRLGTSTLGLIASDCQVCILRCGRCSAEYKRKLPPVERARPRASSAQLKRPLRQFLRVSSFVFCSLRYDATDSTRLFCHTAAPDVLCVPQSCVLVLCESGRSQS